MTDAPTLDTFRGWLGLPEDDHEDDELLQSSLDASLVAQGRVVVYPDDGFGNVVWTDDLVTAVYIRAQRLAARRASPEALVGVTGLGGDFTAARLPSSDPDVMRLEGPYFLPVVS